MTLLLNVQMWGPTRRKFKKTRPDMIAVPPFLLPLSLVPFLFIPFFLFATFPTPQALMTLKTAGQAKTSLEIINCLDSYWEGTAPAHPERSSSCEFQRP